MLQWLNRFYTSGSSNSSTPTSTNNKDFWKYTFNGEATIQKGVSTYTSWNVDKYNGKGLTLQNGVLIVNKSGIYNISIGCYIMYFIILHWGNLIFL
jgi:hypothetical protein